MKIKTSINLFNLIILSVLLLYTAFPVFAQAGDDQDIILYHPPAERSPRDSIEKVNDRPNGYQVNDEATSEYEYRADSLDARILFIEDSIQTRMKFLQDSLMAREAFIRDSIARREHILDSLNVYVTQLPRLLDAAMKAYSEEIIFKTSEIRIVGDSTLSNYENFILTFDFSSPFTPWKSVVNLSAKPPVFELEPHSGRIRSIKSPKVDCEFVYGRNNQILVLKTQSSIMSTRTGNLYKEPVDSVFFNQHGQVVKVKKYFQFYEASATYQRGAKLFLYLAQVRQYQYNTQGEMTRFELTKFCERTRNLDPVKVCSVITYDIVPKGGVYLISRNNQPKNEFSDGLFTYEFSDNNTLSSVSFVNNRQTERWKTIIEVNEDGNVSRYLYDKNGKINQTLLVNYYLDDPRARYKVETVSCSFEDDGISYFQQNNMTGKSRSRDRMTLEWTDWH
ncbi:MAG: hypothetical protein JW801_16295 [Bacteroidales bacterium]|nr:hypothetical protein [Bacteroidales bacterium]